MVGKAFWREKRPGGGAVALAASGEAGTGSRAAFFASPDAVSANGTDVSILLDALQLDVQVFAAEPTCTYFSVVGCVSVGSQFLSISRVLPAR